MPPNPRGDLPARGPLRSPRGLSEHERETAEWLLRNARSPQRDAMLAQLKEARVTRQCPCGCGSLDLLIPSTGKPKEIALTILGDYLYDSQEAGPCGIFLFAKGNILGASRSIPLAIHRPVYPNQANFGLPNAQTTPPANL